MAISNRVLLSTFAALAVIAMPAGAATYSTTFGAPDPGPAAGEAILVDFNGPLPVGYSLGGDYAFGTGSVVGRAAPAGDATQYLYTSPSLPSGVATLSTLDLSSISFYWGSVDDYNSVDVLGAGGVTLLTLSGIQFSPAKGNQGSADSNQRVYFTAHGSEVITGLRFTATGIAFEIDDIAGKLADGGALSPVPEPATWALMLGGFTVVGVGARRRRATVHVSA